MEEGKQVRSDADPVRDDPDFAAADPAPAPDARGIVQTVSCAGSVYGCRAGASGPDLATGLRVAGWRKIGIDWWCPVCLAKIRGQIDTTPDALLAKGAR